MRLVVTGAGGFAGRWLCKHALSLGDEVFAWVRRPGSAPEGVEERVVDITDAQACAEALAEQRPEGLIHLAAMTHLGDCEADPEGAWRANVQGAQNTLNPLPEGARAVSVSSSHVYGPPAELPLREASPCAPRGVYAKSKAAGEAVALEAHPEVVIARAFHHTGPGQSTRYAFADWAGQLAARRRAESQDPLHVGDIEVRRDYCDVRDVVAGYRLLLERGPAGAVVNLCSGEAPSMREMLGWMMAEAPVPVEVDPARLRRSEVRELRGDPSAAEALGWRRRHALAQTLQEMVRVRAQR